MPAEHEPYKQDRQKHRPCWCSHPDKSKYGCFVCDDVPTPLEVDEIADCMYCACGTRNVNPPACDPCVQRLKHAARELDIPEIHGLLNQFRFNDCDWYGEVA